MNLYISNHALKRYIERPLGLDDVGFIVDDMRARGYGEHHLRQYLEVECGIDLTAAYRSILSDRVRLALSKFGGDGAVIIGGYKYVVKNYTLITIKPEKKKKPRRFASPAEAV